MKRVNSKYESCIVNAFIDPEKLLITLSKTSNYKIKDGKIYSKIDNEWKELKDYYKKKG